MVKFYLNKLYRFAPQLVILVLLLQAQDALAQKRSITGTVLSDDGSALPGVSVVEKATNNGAVSDANGNYTISVSDGATLVFSFIGMKTQEVVVGANSELNVTMEADMATLDEVVVVDYGYFTVKKSDMTGSVASLGAKDLQKIPVSSTAQALTGRLPGVNVTTTDGSPDADILIRVRGGGSITQDNSPLYIVDGFIVNTIRDIPPTDIESINVLKDAAATAVYRDNNEKTRIREDGNFLQRICSMEAITWKS
jgi:hypothetical protein